jgi:hypothetical protein
VGKSQLRVAVAETQGQFENPEGEYPTLEVAIRRLVKTVTKDMCVHVCNSEL